MCEKYGKVGAKRRIDLVRELLGVGWMRLRRCTYRVWHCERGRQGPGAVWKS